MAEPLAFDPLVIEDVLLTLDGNDYATALDSITLTPTTTKVEWKPVNGRKTTKVPRPKWALGLNVGQSFNKAGLTAQLIQNHGKRVPFKLQPEGADAAASVITGFVTLEAGAIGGGAETVATASLTLDVDGQPDFTWRDDAPAGTGQ